MRDRGCAGARVRGAAGASAREERRQLGLASCACTYRTVRGCAKNNSEIPSKARRATPHDAAGFRGGAPGGLRVGSRRLVHERLEGRSKPRLRAPRWRQDGVKRGVAIFLSSKPNRQSNRRTPLAWHGHGLWLGYKGGCCATQHGRTMCVAIVPMPSSTTAILQRQNDARHRLHRLASKLLRSRRSRNEPFSGVCLPTATTTATPARLA